MSKRPWLMRTAKLLVVAALMVLVFSSVPWQDRLSWRRGKDEERSEQVRIEGAWNRDDVVVSNEGGTRTVLGGAQPDGTVLEVVPGLRTYWSNLDGWLFALGAFCYFLTVLIAGTRWWWLLRVNGMNVRLNEALRFTWIGTFFNTVVPGATGGDLIKAIYIMKHCPGHRVPALVSVIVDRVLGLASLAILAAVVVLYALMRTQTQDSHDRFLKLAVAIWGVMFGVALLGAFAFSKRLRSLIRLKALLERLPARISNLLRLVDDAVFFYRGHKSVIAWSLVAGIGNHIVSVASAMWIGEALGVGMPRTEYFVLIPVINIISAVPILPNGWGVGEWLYQSLFSQFGAAYVVGAGDPAHVMGTRGVALSVLYRLHLTAWSLLGGLFVLFEKDRVTKADIEQEVALEEREQRGNEAEDHDDDDDDDASSADGPRATG